MSTVATNRRDAGPSGPDRRDPVAMGVRESSRPQTMTGPAAVPTQLTWSRHTDDATKEDPTVASSRRLSTLLLFIFGGVIALQPATAQPIVPTEVIPLFNGTDLSGWAADVPDADDKPDLPASFVVRNGLLVSLGEPRGHLVSERAYTNYRLTAEYRFAGSPGNCGLLVHASQPRALYEMFPQSIEVQLQSGHAGDFWCIHEDIQVPDMESRRPRQPGQDWGGEEGDARNILGLVENAENPLGDWNQVVVEARDNQITVWVNGHLMNRGHAATAREGRIAVQAEGAEVEFRRLEVGPLATNH